MARPRVKIEVVETRQIRQRRIMLDLKVNRAAYTSPSSVAIKGPISKTGFPSKEKGMNNQRKKINPFTRASLKKTLLNDKRENTRARREKKRPGTNADQRVHMAITTENTATAMIFTLGSREWMTDFPLISLLSSIQK